MRILNCLIVEDEPLAADVIRDYVSMVPGLHLSGVYETVVEATIKLREEKIDIIFLDINLPKISGIDFIKTLKKNYHVIFTTAYHQYALLGYDLNVTDYLLKPVEFSRFLQAVNKVFDSNGISSGQTLPEKKSFFFNIDKKRINVSVDSILYVEGQKDYVRIHTESQNLVTKMQISEMETLLKEYGFIRIHKSFVINAGKVQSFNSTGVEIAGKTFRIGRTYKKTTTSFLQKLF